MADQGGARYSRQVQCWTDPSYDIFSKSRRFKDIKFDTERSQKSVNKSSKKWPKQCGLKKKVVVECGWTSMNMFENLRIATCISDAVISLSQNFPLLSLSAPHNTHLHPIILAKCNFSPTSDACRAANGNNANRAFYVNINAMSCTCMQNRGRVMVIRV